MRYTLKKPEILRGKKNFDLIFQHGRKVEGKHLRCLFVANAALCAGRVAGASCVVGFAVSRRVKRAVDRNKLKRLLRESYRRNKIILQPAIENFPGQLALVFLYIGKAQGPAAGFPSLRDIEPEVKKLLGDIAATMRPKE